jgi:hypothetical protein
VTSRNHSTRFVSFAAGVLICGIASLPTARAQDAEPLAGSPSATPPADPSAPPPGADPVGPSGGAPPAVQRSVETAYKPFVLMPFIGLQSEQNANSGTGPGLRVGGVVGGRLSEQFSFNGELLFDWENLNNVPAGLSASAYFLQFALAPLFHVQASSTAEIVAGPKLGLFFAHASESGSFGGITVDGSGTSEGLVLGANVGAFFALSDALSLGGLINFDYLRAQWCSTNPESDCRTSSNGIKVISFAGAAQF